MSSFLREREITELTVMARQEVHRFIVQRLGGRPTKFMTLLPGKGVIASDPSKRTWNADVDANVEYIEYLSVEPVVHAGSKLWSRIYPRKLPRTTLFFLAKFIPPLHANLCSRRITYQSSSPPLRP